jgi:hypothetical protein
MRKTAAHTLRVPRATFNAQRRTAKESVTTWPQRAADEMKALGLLNR